MLACHSYLSSEVEDSGVCVGISGGVSDGTSKIGRTGLLMGVREPLGLLEVVGECLERVEGAGGADAILLPRRVRGVRSPAGKKWLIPLVWVVCGVSV